MSLSIYDEILRNKDDEQSKISLRTIENITKLYTNFAKFGYVFQSNDTVITHRVDKIHSIPCSDVGDGFQPIQNDQMRHIELSNDGLKADLNPHKEVIDFWTNLERLAHQLAEKNLEQDMTGL